ncbi:MAG: cytochrome c4 [Haliea sp.]|nr:MAG: cytochrome c4 [Haliea sp.]
MKLLAPLLMAATLAATAISSFAQTAAAPAASAPASAAAAAAPAAPVASAPAVVAAAPATGKPDLAQGEAKYTAVCAACHAADGNSGIPANPKLAQQHPEYLVKQLQEFKNGKRASPVMQAFAAQLSDADMKNIAWWVASKKNKVGFAKDKELVSLGERIYRGGIADRQIAACAGCHSPNGAGIPAQYPRLGGQHADYTALQLTSFRDGGRKNSLQMSQVAAKLNDREIKAVADYIAGLR